MAAGADDGVVPVGQVGDQVVYPRGAGAPPRGLEADWENTLVALAAAEAELARREKRRPGGAERRRKG